MLKMITRSLLVVALIAISLPSWAQQDPEARRILDAVSNKYRAVSSFSADISQTLSNSAAGINEVITGTIAVKGDMFRINMGPQQIANDSKKVYVFLEDINEVTIDYYYPGEGDITPSALFDLYKSGYKYTKLADETIGGKSCHIIDLIPENSGEAQFFRIRLAIEKNSLMLQQYQMWDRSNTVYSYRLSNAKMNANLSDSLFKIDGTTNPEADIVDLTDY